MTIRNLAAAAVLAAFTSAAFAQEDAAPAADAAPAVSEAQAAPAVLDWPVPEPVDFVCPFKGEIDYEPGDIACGFITVPENREDPDTRFIRLHYVKIAATGEEEDYREDPVIYLTGGPGVGVGGYVDRLREHDLLDQRDLYILEQRGIGASGDFCPFYGMTERALTHADDIEEAQRNAEEITRNCFEAARAAGVDLTAYNTVENARDVKALRQALGYEQWNVWGISYGSHLGQMLALQDPDGISALVIDAIVPNDLTDLMRRAHWANVILEKVFTDCADAAVCDGLEARFEAALDSVRDNPIIVETDDAELFPEGEARFTGLILAFAPFSMAYEQDEHPAIPAVIDTLARKYETRDETFFELLAGGMDEVGPGGLTISQGMSSAIRCNDGYVHAGAAAAERDLAENPRFAGLISTVDGARYAARMCEEEGLAPRDRSDYRFVETAIPTLVINGGWDPVTPPELAEYIAPGFSNGRYIEVPYAGHGPTRSMAECAGPVLNAFFDDPDPAALDASCLEEGVAAPVYLDLAATDGPIKLAAKAADDPKKMVVPGAWAGASLLVLLLGFVMIPAGAAARLVDRQPATEIKADLAAARWLGWLAAIAGLGFAALTGYGLWATSEVSMIAVIGGLHPDAAAAPWLALAVGVLGLLTLISLVMRRASGGSIRIGSLIGLVLIGVAAVALAAFAFVYDLGPL
ncbi:MAG: alpha/beta fold hydrolase [Oceanicaulis sp.]